MRDSIFTRLRRWLCCWQYLALRTAVSAPTIVPIYFLEVSGAGDNSDCPLPDLLSGFASFNSSDLPIFPICDPDPQVFCAVSFEEGSVFYNGNTSNSTAFYTVSAAYCINSTSERKCEAGQWINEVILEKGGCNFTFGPAASYHVLISHTFYLFLA